MHTLNHIQKFITPIIHFFSTCRSISLLTRSYTFPRSIKLTYSLHFFSRVDLIYTPPPYSEIPLLIINQRLINSRDYVSYIPAYIFLIKLTGECLSNSYSQSSLPCSCTVEQSQQISSLHYTTFKGNNAQLPDPVVHHVTFNLYHPSSDLILTCRLSIFKPPHSYFYFSSPPK